jgi:hypothetical protein
MIKAVLTHSASGKELHSEEYYQEGEEGRVLLIQTIPKQYGFFKTGAYTVQGTFEQITPKGDGSLELTDMIVTFEKKNLGVVTINFHDGTNTAQLLRTPLTDSSLNLSMNFVGRWKGWAAAHIDVIISGADSIGTVAIGYIRHNEANSLPYAEWNALR